MPNFEENPAYFKAKDLLYFAYKYYLNPPEKAETEELESYFRTMQFTFPEQEEIISSIQLSSGGDLMPYKWLNPANTQHLWDEIGPWFFDAEIVFANLETPIDITQPLSAVPEVMLNNMYFNGDPTLFHLFNGQGKYKGFDILSTANNHSFDMGIHGVHQTLDYLDDLGIAHTGTSRNTEEQWEIPIIEKEGIKVAFVAITYCLNHLHLPENQTHLVNLARLNLPNADISLIKKLVKKAKEKADFVVLSMHHGNAYQAYPSAHTVANVHAIFEQCGPDLILGGHPHNAQPMEQHAYVCPHTGQYKKGIAVYSQGDFVAYDIFTWCHLHLGIKFTLSRLKNQEVQISAMEVMPQFLWSGDRSEGFDFRFIPLNKTLAYEAKMSKRSKMELAEIRRYWQKHLAPQLSTMEA